MSSTPDISWPRSNKTRTPCLTTKAPSTCPIRPSPCAATSPGANPAGSKAGRRTDATKRSARPRPDGRHSSCTTARPTPTATSISATRSTRFSRTSSSRPGRCPASTPPTSRAGTATACRSNCRSRRPTEKTSTRRNSASCAAPTPRNRSNGRKPTSSDSACWATGRIRIAPWTSSSRPTPCACWVRSSRPAIFIKAPSRCIGASIAARRWPRPRSSTRTRLRPRSMSALPWPTAPTLPDVLISQRSTNRFSSSSGRLRPGRCPPTRRWRCTPISSTRWCARPGAC